MCVCVDVTVERGEKRDGLERLLRIQRARAGRKEKKETKEKKEKKETSGVAALIGFGFIFFFLPVTTTTVHATTSRWITKDGRNGSQLRIPPQHHQQQP